MTDEECRMLMSNEAGGLALCCVISLAAASACASGDEYPSESPLHWGRGLG